MRIVTVAELASQADTLVPHVAEAGPIIVTEDGRPAAVVLRLSEDEFEDYLLTRNEGLKADLEQAYAECLAGAGRPAAELLAGLSE
jgi:PHD/YefM family antitoxin component YafN of YafNO toxin-antitoxin module